VRRGSSGSSGVRMWEWRGADVGVAGAVTRSRMGAAFKGFAPV